jgi:hypothetical protein
LEAVRQRRWSSAYDFQSRAQRRGVTLIKDGDHRLSRPKDIERLLRSGEADFSRFRSQRFSQRYQWFKG